MHCLLLHIHGAGRRDNQRLWNLACDIQADHYAEILEGTSGAAGVVKTADQICREWEDRYDCLRRQGEQKLFEQELRREEERHRKDDHSLWYLPDTDDRRRCSGSEDGTRRGDPKRWIRAACRIGGEISGGERKVGTRAGRKSVSYTLRRKKQYDFREFLRQFAVCGEAMELDQDSFDYIPYWYSLSHYDEVVFLEPLEYRELNWSSRLTPQVPAAGLWSRDFWNRPIRSFGKKKTFLIT